MGWYNQETGQNPSSLVMPVSGKRKRADQPGCRSNPAEIAPSDVYESQTAYRKDMDVVAKSMVMTRSLTAHHDESYEVFVHHSLPVIVEEHSPLLVNCSRQHSFHKLYFMNTRPRPPSIREASGHLRYIKPKEAHLRKATYSFDCLTDIHHKVYSSTPEDPTNFKLMETKFYRNALFARIPCMLNSSVCNDRLNLDAPYRNHSGLFIINGYHKTLISQSQVRSNTVYVHPPKTLKGKTTIIAELRAMHSTKIRSTSTLFLKLVCIRATSVPEITIAIPFVKYDVPFTVLFRLLGITDLPVMISLITGNGASYKLQHLVRNMASIAPAY